MIDYEISTIPGPFLNSFWIQKDKEVALWQVRWMVGSLLVLRLRLLHWRQESSQF